MSRRVHPNVHFSIFLLWQKYFRASSSTYVGMRCKNKPSTHNFPWFFSNSLLLYTLKKRERFGVSSYSHSLPKNQWIPHNRKNSFYVRIQAGQDCHTASTNVPVFSWFSPTLQLFSSPVYSEGMQTICNYCHRQHSFCIPVSSKTQGSKKR